MFACFVQEIKLGLKTLDFDRLKTKVKFTIYIKDDNNKQFNFLAVS